MNRPYKQAYEAPKMESLKLRQSLNVLEAFSIETTADDPTLGGEWGDLDDQPWGRYKPRRLGDPGNPGAF